MHRCMNCAREVSNHTMISPGTRRNQDCVDWRQTMKTRHFSLLVSCLSALFRDRLAQMRTGTGNRYPIPGFASCSLVFFSFLSRYSLQPYNFPYPREREGQYKSSVNIVNSFVTSNDSNGPVTKKMFKESV